MKKETKGYLSEICDNMEVMLANATPKDKWEAGLTLCKFAATFATNGLKEKDGGFDIFLPIKLLEQSKTELIDTIDKEFLSVLGDECAKLAKEQKK